MVFVVVELDPIYEGCGPFNYQSFQAVFLIEVSVHILLHGLSCHFRIFTFFIKLYFLAVHILDGVLELLQRENTLLDHADLLGLGPHLCLVCH
jgi:hypothetical protein